MPESLIDETSLTPTTWWGRIYHALFGTIRNKIIVPFLLLTLLVTMLGTFVVTRLVASSVQDRLTTQLLETSRAAGDRVVAWERQQLDTLRLVVFTVGVPDALESGDDQLISDTLVALASNQNTYLLLGMDTAGTVIAGTRRSSDGYEPGFLVGETLADQAPVAAVLAGESDQYGDKYAGIVIIDGEQILLTVAPVHGATGELVGAVAAGTPMNIVLAQTKIDTLADLTLYTSDGEAVQTTFVLPEKDNFEPLHIDETVYSDALGRSEEITPLHSTILNEREYQTAYVPLVIRRDTLGVLGVSWPSTLITSLIRTSRNSLAIIFSLVAMTVVGVGYLVANRLTQPIRRLAHVAEAVGAGDLQQQSKIRTSDEIGVLGRVFDTMTLRLNEKTEALIRAYEEQERRAAFLSAVIASAADGTVVMDRRGHILHENPAARAILSRDELLWHSTLPEMLRSAGREEPTMQRVQLKDQWVEAKATPVITPAGEEVGVLVTLRDITEQMLTDQMRTAFILQMSHELYTPLVAAKGFAELAGTLVREKVPSAHDLISRSMSSMTVLRELLTQIIDISRMIRGGFEIKPESVDLAALIQSILDEYRELMDAKHLRLQVDVPKLRVYTGGKEPLRWAIKGLIKNACDYTLPGGLIKITAAEENGAFVLRVRDTGVGIARHERPRIFEQFYRGQPVAPSGRVIDIRGAGLGLFVVDQVVRAHHGEVEVWSEQGIGSEFTVRLPYQEGASEAQPTAREPAQV